MNDPFCRPTVVPALCYAKPWAALDWMEKAFGFERGMVIADGDGKTVHSEMRVGDGLIHIGPEAGYNVSPTTVSGRNTQSIHIHLKEGFDAHCEHACDRRSDRAGTRGPVLWGSHLFANGPAGACLDLRPNHTPRHP